MVLDREAKLKLIESTADNELKTYPIAQCLLCGEDRDIYICERGHNKTFCKPCLSRVTHVNDNRSEFSARCRRSDCNFLPLIQKNETAH